MPSGKMFAESCWPGDQLLLPPPTKKLSVPSAPNDKPSAFTLLTSTGVHGSATKHNPETSSKKQIVPGCSSTTASADWNDPSKCPCGMTRQPDSKHPA
eukprot:4303914-Amphidinium_carterae.1